MKPKNSAEWRGGIALSILVVFLILLSLWSRGRFVAAPAVEVKTSGLEQTVPAKAGADSVANRLGRAGKADGESQKKRKTKKRKKNRHSGRHGGSPQPDPREFLDESLDD